MIFFLVVLERENEDETLKKQKIRIYIFIIFFIRNFSPLEHDMSFFLFWLSDEKESKSKSLLLFNLTKYPRALCG